MTIADRLAGGDPLFSVEFFPPKDDAGEARLWESAGRLAAYHPDFVSVTYGANGSTRDRTIGVTRRLAGTTGLTTMGHLTCVAQSVDEVAGVIDQYAASGVGHVFAVRGDMPGGPTVPWEPHPAGLANATRLVELIRARGDLEVGVAAFPDPHPAQYDAALDARILADKWRAGAAFAITQMFFRPAAYTELVDRVRSLGCPIPVIPGLMPITSASQVTAFAAMSGTAMPAALRDRLAGLADDPAAVRALGVAVGTDLALDLLDRGAPGLHFFSQNRAGATLAIWEAVRRGATTRVGPDPR